MYTQKPMITDPIVRSEEESVEDHGHCDITWFKNIHQSGKVSFTEVQTAKHFLAVQSKTYYNNQLHWHRDDGAAAKIAYMCVDGEWVPDYATWYDDEVIMQTVAYRADGTAWHAGWRESRDGDLIDTTDENILKLFSVENIE